MVGDSPFLPCSRRQWLIGGAASLLFAGQTRAQAPTSEASLAVEPPFFRLAAGPLGSATFALAVGLATGLSNPPGGRGCERGGSCGVPGLIVVAQGAAQGPRRALDLLRAGQAEAALVPARELLAWLSAGDANAQDVLRTLATLSAETLHVFVRQDDPLVDVAELAGQPLALAQGPDAGTGFARQVITYGHLIKPGERAQLMPLEFALDALAEGQVRAAMATLWPPNPLVLARARTLPLRLLALGPDAVSPQVRAALSVEPVAGGLYPGVAAVDTLGHPLLLVVRTDTPAPLAEALVKALWSPVTLKGLSNLGAVGQFSLAGARRSTLLPLHPGAEAGYAALPK
jgi:TRAP transporter TAXI family solute receptor